MSDADGISMQATLPLAWSEAGETSVANAELRAQTNIALLRALAAIDVIAPEHETHSDQTQKALERMEAKIDMVLLILAQLTGASMSLPVETQVTLSNRSIIWLEFGDTPAIDQSVVVELYLNPRLPQALKIPVVIKELQPMDSGVKIIAELEDCSEEFDEWLTHTLFRYHRRALQASRQA